MTTNGLGIAEVGAFEKRPFKYSTKVDRGCLKSSDIDDDEFKFRLNSKQFIDKIYF
jgi:hypothetical protein